MLLRVTTNWPENGENNEEIRRLVESLLGGGVLVDPAPGGIKVELVSEPTDQQQCQFENVNGKRCFRAAEFHAGDVSTCSTHRWWALDRASKK